MRRHMNLILLILTARNFLMRPCMDVLWMFSGRLMKCLRSITQIVGTSLNSTRNFIIGLSSGCYGMLTSSLCHWSGHWWRFCCPKETQDETVTFSGAVTSAGTLGPQQTAENLLLHARTWQQLNWLIGWPTAGASMLVVRFFRGRRCENIEICSLIFLFDETLRCRSSMFSQKFL